MDLKDWILNEFQVIEECDNALIDLYSQASSTEENAVDGVQLRVSFQYFSHQQNLYIGQ